MGEVGEVVESACTPDVVMGDDLDAVVDGDAGVTVGIGEAVETGLLHAGVPRTEEALRSVVRRVMAVVAPGTMMRGSRGWSAPFGSFREKLWDHRGQHLALAVGLAVLKRRRRNPLESLIFTDGSVKRMDRTGDEASLDFTDYRGSMVHIRFSGVTEVETRPGTCTFSVLNQGFQESAKGWTMRLADDDDELLLEITYEDAVFDVE